MTVDEFLAWDSGDDLTYELVDGWPVAQSAPSSVHGVMLVNGGSALQTRLLQAGRPCMVEGGSALRISGKANVRAPDLLVRCGSPVAGKGAPVLAVEILSRSNSADEMADKREDYLAVGIREVVEISQHRPVVRIFRHIDDRWTIETVVGLSSSLRLDSLDMELPVAEFFRGVDFAPADGGPSPSAADS